MDNNYNNDRVSGMKSILDVLVILILSMAGFVTFGETPAGKRLIESESSKVIEKTVEKKSITILNPTINEQVYGFVEVKGNARSSDNEINIRIRDGVTDKIVFEKKVATNSVEIGGFGVYSLEVDFSEFVEGRRYFIEAFDHDLKTGKEINKVQVAVIYWRK